MRIIDARARPNTPEYMTYFDAPGKRERQQAKLGFAVPGSQSLESFMGDVDAAGIDMIVFTGRDNSAIGGWSLPNDYIADACRRYPGRVVGIAGIDPTHPEAMVRAEVDRAVRQLGLRGISLDVARYQFGPNDRRLYPLYEQCIALDVPVFLTMGPAAGGKFPLRLNDPMLVDEVAVDLPKLKIVCAHAGWPFVQEMIAVAYRHDNVYFDNSAYHFMPGAERLVDAANSIIGDKMLFASAFPFNPLYVVVQHFMQLPLRADVLERVMAGNAARLLGLDP